MPQLVRNKIVLKVLRKKLRVDQTNAEAVLWSRLRRKQLLGIKFHRQFSVGNYILDFFSPSINLAIELDGSQHAEKDVALYDSVRTAFLNKLNIRVIRFWNNQVFNDLDAVLEAICHEFRTPS